MSLNVLEVARRFDLNLYVVNIFLKISMKFVDLVKIDNFSKSFKIGRSLYVVYYYSSFLFPS